MTSVKPKRAMLSGVTDTVPIRDRDHVLELARMVEMPAHLPRGACVFELETADGHRWRAEAVGDPAPCLPPDPADHDGYLWFVNGFLRAWGGAVWREGFPLMGLIHWNRQDPGRRGPTLGIAGLERPHSAEDVIALDEALSRGAGLIRHGPGQRRESREQARERIDVALRKIAREGGVWDRDGKPCAPEVSHIAEALILSPRTVEKILARAEWTMAYVKQRYTDLSAKTGV